MIVQVPNIYDLNANIRAIPSKSQAHRLLICAALSDSPTKILCRKSSRDILATCSCLNSLFRRVEVLPDGFMVRPTKSKPAEAVLDCCDSGSTYRFLVPLVLALGIPSRFSLAHRLPARPMDVYWRAFDHEANQASVRCQGLGTPEVRIRGSLGPGLYPLRGDVSSQFVSGLIFALPLLDGESVIELSGRIESCSYIELTLAAVARFGIRAAFIDNRIIIPGNQRYRSPGELVVEGDWSNAAFWLCAAAIKPERELTCTGLSAHSLQGDRAVADILRNFGAAIDEEDNLVRVSGRELKGMKIDVRNIPDLVPVLAVVAAAAHGDTVFTNAGRLRLKESDRLTAVKDTLDSLGGNAEICGDSLIVHGRGFLRGGRMDSCNDHRIAMMAAISAAICREPVVISRAEAVEKSYPDFWHDLAALGTKAERLD